MDDEALAVRLGDNIRALRDARGLTQAQLSKLSGLPRATWANLESGTANPTLAVLRKVAVALQISFEELLAAPRTGTRCFPLGTLPTRTQGNATVRKLLPDKVPGMELERIELPAGGRMNGVPHTPGTREYLTCERGTLVLSAGGTSWTLEAGDVLSFRGDQKHAYSNPTKAIAVGYSVVMLEPLV